MQSIYALHVILKIDQHFPYKSTKRQVLLALEVQYAFREVGITF
jgi:hypothetical protein